ncbi:MAG: PAS-domain containing protein, partial [Pseudomonadota bacterium]
MHSSNRQAARKRGRNGNRFALLISAVGLSLVSVSAANAQGEAVGQLQSILDEAAPVIKTIDVLLSVLFIGLLAAAFVTAILGMRQRSKIAAENSALRHALSDKTTQANRLAAVVSADGQATLIWTVDDTKPQLFGQLSAKAAAPSKSASFLAFGRWIEPKSAVQLERSIAELRENARSFSGVFETISGQPLEVTGRTSGGAAIVYMRELSEERARYYRFQSEHEAVVERLSIFEKLLNAVPSPAWLREPDGSLTWANTAYLNAMGTHDLVSASRLSDDPFRVSRNDRSNQALVRDGVLNDETTTVVAGDRRVFRTTVVSTEGNLIGLAEDHTSEDSVRRELSKTISLHEETLDGLNTAVAMFDENKRLRFYNQAFAELWDLPPVFLEKLPDMSLLLNQLRTEGKLPEMPEWQRWKNNILDRFQAVAPDQDWWHLPDGRMIRVMAHPHPKGGMTWVFENFTERRDLESRFAILTRVQSETLDHLAEGVAVFSPNGNLELHNPAFSEFWGLRKLLERERVHITAIQNSWNEHDAEYDLWSELTGLVTGFDEQRGTQNGRFEFADQTLTWSALPLPNSQTMITFMDTTGVEQIER